MSRSLQESSLLNTVDYRSLSVGSVPTSEYLIATTVVGATPAESVEFDVSDYAGVYKHLQIVGVARSTRASTSDGLRIQLNGDTGSNYVYHALRGDGSSVISYDALSRTAMSFDTMPAASSTASAFGAFVVDLLDFSDSNKNTTARSLGGFAGTGNELALGSSLWLNTAAVTSITLFAGFGDLVTGSRFSIYGVTA